MLKENQIRNSKITVEQNIALLTDIGRLLTNSKFFKEINCPSCDSDKYINRFDKNGFHYVTCENCSTFFINPRPTPEILESFYRESLNYAFWNSNIFPKSEEMRLQKIFIPRINNLIKMIEKYKINKNAILEVGGGFGTFCSELAKRNIFKKIVVVEPVHELAETCKKRGLFVLEDPIEKVHFQDNDKFDVIVSFEVIEHLFSPQNFISSISSFLNENGLLIITCPNGSGFDIEILKTESVLVDHEHLNYFNPKSIKHLFEKNKLEILEIITPGELDAELVRNKVLSDKINLNSQPFLKKVLIDEWDLLGEKFQQFLIDNKLSSNMWVVAKKIC